MTRKSKFDLNQIFEYWSRRPEEFKIDHRSSWYDLPMIKREISHVAEHLEGGWKVLDAGCGNGFTACELAKQKDLNIHGIDYVPELIDAATKGLADQPGHISDRVSFSVGNILEIDADDSAFDAVVSIRVLINLHNFENQIRAINECARVVKPGGKILLSEATKQGRDNLNAFRAEWGLPELPVPKFNFYLDLDQLVDNVPAPLRLESIIDFSSTYYVATRLLKPLLASTAKKEIDVGDTNMHWNRWFANVPSIGEYGIQRLLVFTKL